MEVLDAVNRRMSVRAYRPDPVDGAVVRELLDLAARAPSGGNLQPWRVQALTGQPLAALKAAMATRLGAPDTPEYDVYPPNLWDPLRARRFQVGEDLYAALGIPREDKPARLMQFARNGDGFGAPVMLFFSIDRRCGPPQWSDLGMFMQTFMLLAVEWGLDTCAQEFWAHYHQVVADHVGLPEGHMLFSGMALGYRDETAPVNAWRSRREPFEAWGEMQGF
ncbi:MAG: nitroreductase [Alphaproteobacteria bacterium]|nr:nitroreductase [Alphaproteobacteria bacterium]